jgi:hypothetical protein
VIATVPVTFRFNAIEHAYIDLSTGAVLPHITGMLQQAGWIDDTWMTEESSIRGTAVHRLTADYDLGALHVESCVSRHRGYLLGHVKAMGISRPEILSVEEPIVHPAHRFGGRPDRVVKMFGLHGVLEIKSGVRPSPPRAGEPTSHELQTALQAILVAADLNLPAELVARFCLYLKANGRFKLEEHKQQRDFDYARRIIREWCR